MGLKQPLMALNGLIMAPRWPHLQCMTGVSTTILDFGVFRTFWARKKGEIGKIINFGDFSLKNVLQLLKYAFFDHRLENKTCWKFNSTLDCPDMSRYDIQNGQELPNDILLFISFGIFQDMRVTNLKTRFLKNGPAKYFTTNVPHLLSISMLQGHRSQNYTFFQKFSLL